MGYPLTSLIWLQRGLSFTTHCGNVFFQFSADQLLDFTWSQDQKEFNLLPAYGKSWITHERFAFGLV